jgi:hypothetical protein
MEPAEELRTAADKIRKLAGQATEGPWETTWRGQEYQLDGYRGGTLHSVSEWTYAVATWEPQASEQRAECDTADADYIAAMHPGVGNALADWLEHEAAGHEAVQGLGNITTELINVQLEQVGYGAQITHSTLPQALAVARAILGTQEQQ